MISRFPPAQSVGCPVLPNQTMRHALLVGARILTASGEQCIESIGPGHRIISRDFGMVPVRAVHRAMIERGMPLVHIPAGALGRGKPERDVSLPPDQPVALRGWRARALFGAREARVAAARLVDGTIIRLLPGPQSAAISLVLDAPSILYVDGLEIVSASVDAMPGRSPAPTDSPRRRDRRAG